MSYYNATALTINCIVQELSRGKEAALEQERERLKSEHSMEVAMFLCVFVFVFVYIYLCICVCVLCTCICICIRVLYIMCINTNVHTGCTRAEQSRGAMGSEVEGGGGGSE